MPKASLRVMKSGGRDAALRRPVGAARRTCLAGNTSRALLRCRCLLTTSHSARLLIVTIKIQTC